MAAIVIKAVAGTMAIITIIIKIYMKQICFYPIGWWVTQRMQPPRQPPLPLLRN